MSTINMNHGTMSLSGEKKLSVQDGTESGSNKKIKKNFKNHN